MSLKTRLVVSAIAASAMVSTIAAQDSPIPISPRRMFLCDTPPCGESSTPPKAVAKTTPKTKTPVKPAVTSPSAPHINVAQTAPIVTAADVPLVLRYWVLDPDHNNTQVSPDKTFHANEHILVKVETNSPGYMYVINQGTSGEWTPMFPIPEINGGKNFVEAHHEYYLPSKLGMRFDDHPGTESLIIAFSRQPVPDLEEFIYSLKSAPRAQPDSPAPQQSKQIVANARIDNSTVERLRTAMSRDLIVEKVTPETPADGPQEQKETAVYVANPTGRSDSQLITDVRLVHR